MKKRLLSFVMLFCMTLSLLPAAALAAPEEEPAPVQVTAPVSKTVAVQDESAAQDEDLFYQYMLQQARGEQTRGTVSLFSTGDAMARSGLSDTDKIMYDKLKTAIIGIANGDLTSTVITLKPIDFGADGSYTKDDLHLGTLGIGGFSDEAIEKLDEKMPWDFDLSAVLNALLVDCPYDLFWFKKTSDEAAGDYGGCSVNFVGGYTGTYNLTTGEMLTIRYTDETSITVTFAVTKDYHAGELNEDNIYTQVNTDKIAAAKAAAYNASLIVEAHRNEADFEKLCSYKEEICRLVDYNEAAVDPDDPYDGGYGDPWQLVYVFDEYSNDPLTKTTNVVCEGYAKAFQYLCDLYTFSTGVQCYSVTGTMTGATGAGPHMWNIVTMPDGQNYLVDVTNVDEGTVGYPDYLFLRGVVWDTASKCHVNIIKPGSSTSTPVSYQYDGETLAEWNSDILTLSTNDYGECQVSLSAAPGTVDPTAVTYYRNKIYDPAFSLPTPEWGSNRFDGWITAEGLAVTAADIIAGIYSDGSPIGEAVSLKADWSCAVTFEPNGGTFPDPADGSRFVPVGNAIGALPSTEGGKLTLPAGYDSLAGWYYTDGELAGTLATATDIVKDALTLTARWTFTTTLEPEGGTGVPESVTLTEGLSVGALPSPVKDFHTFDGWYAGETKVESTDIASKAVHGTLTAHWNFVGYDYKLNFADCEGVSPEKVTSSETSYSFNVSAITPDNRDDYAFMGWSTVENDRSSIVSSVDMTNTTPGSQTEQTVYAIWLPSMTLSQGSTLGPVASVPWTTSSNEAVAVICDGIVCTLSPGDTIISNGTDEYLLTVTAGEPSTMTDGEDSLTWFFHHDPAKVIVVGSSDTSISETAPVLVACYDNNDKMLSVQFITASTGSADVTVGSKTVKLFWINTTGFTPRCARSPAVPLAPVSVGGGGGGSAPAP